MPTFPKIPDTDRKTGIVEVTIEFKAESSPHSDRHVGVTGKIAIYLQAVTYRGEQNGLAGITGNVAVDQIDIRGQPVGDDDFLEESPNEEMRSRRKRLKIRRPELPELRHKFARLFYRPGKHGREKRDEQRNRHHIFLNGDFPAIQVDGITQGLKCKKRYPDRQNPIVDAGGDRQSRTADKSTQRRTEESGVFEYQQRQQGENYCNSGDATPPLGITDGDQTSGAVSNRRDQHQPKQEIQPKQAVKNIACEQQKQITPLQRADALQEANTNPYRKEEK